MPLPRISSLGVAGDGVTPMKAFISYSHKDTNALERLRTHLSVLRRQGAIEDWCDRQILAGDEIDSEVDKRLDECGIFLPLVSPDFLASHYCYDREMTVAIQRHDAKKLRVMPMIVEPCDWLSSPLARFKAVPRDGVPISTWPNVNEAYLDVVNELRRVLVEIKPVADKERPPTAVKPTTTSGQKYRIKKDFDEIDRAQFRDEAFEEMRAYFETAAREISGHGDSIRSRFRDLTPTSFTCTVVNKAHSRGVAHITVHKKSGNMGFGDVYFSFQEDSPPNTANGSLSIDAGEYHLFLRPDIFAQKQGAEQLQPKQAAEMLWKEFIEKAGISYD